jgi:mRNA interferase MazF
MRRGDIYWVDLGEPVGSEPGYKRPVLVVQDDEFNRSKLATVIVLSLTTNLELKNMPGCVLLKSQESGLNKDSVVNATQIRTIDRSRMIEHVGQLDDMVMFMIDNAIKRVMGL